MNRATLLLSALFLFSMIAHAGTESDLAPLALRDTDGGYIDFPGEKKRALVLFFADTTCPVANRYVPTMNAISEKFGPKDIEFVAVYPASSELWPVARHVNEFKVNARAVLDVDGTLAKRFKPTVLSEVVVLGREMKLVYQGRIDDQFTLGESKSKATTHELETVLNDTVEGRATHVIAKPASGCAISGDDRKRNAGLTFTKDIGPLMKANCASCHQQNGTAPFSLTSYAEVVAMSPAMNVVLKEYRMPPWFADTSPTKFEHATSLSQADRFKIIDWIEGGTIRGKGDEPKWPHSKPGWALGRPDRVIEIPAPEPIPASGAGYFKEFAIDLGNKTDLWVDQVEVKPDQVKAVHHIAVYTRKKGQLEPSEYEGERWGYFSAFVPGSGPTIFPKGFAKRIPAGHELLVNIHYVPYGAEIVDRSKIALYFSKSKRPTEVMTDSVRSKDFEIPPGVRFHTVNAEQVLKDDILLRTIVPHAHFRGRAFTMKAIAPDGVITELLSVPKYTISWQAMYTLKSPVRLAKGTKLQCQVTYDNSERNIANPDPKKKVVFGPQSEDEMMFCYYDFLDAKSAAKVRTTTSR
ncbi:redoxin domain-containing protein [soil metagenome]